MAKVNNMTHIVIWTSFGFDSQTMSVLSEGRCLYMLYYTLSWEIGLYGFNERDKVKTASLSSIAT